MTLDDDYVPDITLNGCTWVVIGLAAVYLGYRIGPVLLERFLLWTS